MKKKLLGCITTLMLLTFILHSLEAAEFGENSATITNSIWPMKVGDRKIWEFPKINGKRNYKYDDAVEIEQIDGVNCLRINSVDTYNSWFTSFWLAQDLSGNVYLFQIYDTENDLMTLTKDTAFLFVPSVVQVGDEFNGGTYTVVSVAETVGQLSTGFGPYTNCIKAAEADGDFVYYAPDVGAVLKESTDNERTYELKEVITTDNIEVVIPSKVTLTSPSSQINDSTPTFTWAEDPASTWYKLWVGTSQNEKIFAKWLDAAEVCSSGSCSFSLEADLSVGNYEWYIKSWSEKGKIWSDGMSFTVSE